MPTPHASETGATGIPVLQTRVPGTHGEPELRRTHLRTSQLASFPSTAQREAGGLWLRKPRVPTAPAKLGAPLLNPEGAGQAREVAVGTRALPQSLEPPLCDLVQAPALSS